MVVSRFLSFVASVVLASGGANAEPTERPFVAPLFSDHMVLQRDQSDPIWGWTTPGAKVTVSMEGKTAEAVAGPDGKWMTKIVPPKAGGPYTLTVSGPETITFSDVLVGDVWICSGQSNMEWGIGQTRDAEKEVANANHPRMRLFQLGNALANRPSSVIKGTWRTCTPQTVMMGRAEGFSAVGYFFGRELEREVKVPIGLIQAAWGGTIAESWTSRGAIEAATKDFDGGLKLVDQLDKLEKEGVVDGREIDRRWFADADIDAKVSEPGYEASDWRTLPGVPREWGVDPLLATHDGAVWMRRTFDVPADAVGRAATLHVGDVDDGAAIFVNGRLLEATFERGPRALPIPAGLLKAGKNAVAVWIYDRGGLGGILGDPKDLAVSFADAPTVPLAGDWQVKEGPTIQDLPPPLSLLAGNPNLPTRLFNGMIAPLVPFGIKGVIWYQGESNGERGYQYRMVLPTLIADWRKQWDQGDFPFLIVQLAAWGEIPKEPGESPWAELREAQELTTRKLPNVGLATAIDIGDPKDIHPTNKQEVGRRLGLVARAQVYGEKVAFAGPTFERVERDGNALRVSFRNAGGLHAKGGDLKGFAVAGNDRKFHWATAKIVGDHVLLKSPDVPVPVAARYNWANSPVGNLYNADDLPALPFRSDDWPGVSANAR